MRMWRWILLCIVCVLHSCPASAAPEIRVVHVYVALADNQYQGIIPVPAKFGNGNAPASNLYWGAAYGVKSFFRTNKDWRLVTCGSGTKTQILERCIFKHRTAPVYLVADAYEGRRIRDTVTDFLSAAGGVNPETLSLPDGGTAVTLNIGAGADLVAYVGHDAFMDFDIPAIRAIQSAKPSAAIVLACASKQYFRGYLKAAGAAPLLWTTGLMAPEAYTLKAALDGWIAHEDGEAIRERAARAYDQYQRCGLRAARRLFATGW